MTVLLDVFAIGVLLVCVVSGINRGFAKTFFSLAGSVGGFIGAILFSKPLGSFINTALVTPMLRESTTEYLKTLFGAQKTPDGSEFIAIDQYFENIPDILKEYLNKMGVELSNVKEAFNVAPTVEAGRQAAVDAIFSVLASTVSVCIAFAVIFFGVMILSSILGMIFEAVFKIPVLKEFNKLAGGVAGLVKAVIILFVVVSIFNTIQPILKKEDVAFLNSADVEKTQVFKHFAIFSPQPKDNAKEEAAK